MAIIQAAAIITSLLSLCSRFVTYRTLLEEHDWTCIDLVTDMVWNILSVSPRVIALALFASYELYWFWGLVITQIGIVIICYTLFHYFNTDDVDLQGVCGFFFMLILNTFTGMGWVFTMFAVLNTVTFPIYLLYWVVIFVENTIIISLWHQWSDKLGVWYHNVALFYVIIAYAVSAIIKFVHCYFYKPNKNEKNIFKWKFFHEVTVENTGETYDNSLPNKTEIDNFAIELNKF